MLKKLPIGLSSLTKLIEHDCVYVDKTKYAYTLITKGWRYFLSRPRRFGKSLFVSTLEEIFRGNQALFKDLWIGKSDYSWKEHGVVKLDFSKFSSDTVEAFKLRFITALKNIFFEYGVEMNSQAEDINVLFEHLINQLHQKYGKVAVLIDEYDSPLLHTIADDKKAQAINKLLQNLFATIKSLDQYINFVFITGVSSFTKAGIFSGMNNLNIITLDSPYAALCGYTDQEIDYYFTDHMREWVQDKQLDYYVLRSAIQRWYNGYTFHVNEQKVYNPFSFINALHKKEFKNFWIQSGNPTFLIEELKKEYRSDERSIDPESLVVDQDDLLSSFDIAKVPLPALLFQTGYLTIGEQRERSDTSYYYLKYPNFEVATAFTKYLLGVFVDKETSDSTRIATGIYETFSQQKIAEAIALLKQLFAGVPYTIHEKKESFYHGLLHIACKVAGIETVSEQLTASGRIDAVLIFEKVTYIIEIKFDSDPEIALKQIKKQKYYEQFLHPDKKIILLGLSFNRKPKKFDIEYKVETIS